MELGDYEQLAAVLLEGQVAEPLEDHRHVLGASVGRKRRGKCVTGKSGQCNNLIYNDDQL